MGIPINTTNQKSTAYLPNQPQFYKIKSKPNPVEQVAISSPAGKKAIEQQKPKSSGGGGRSRPASNTYNPDTGVYTDKEGLQTSTATPPKEAVIINKNNQFLNDTGRLKSELSTKPKLYGGEGEYAVLTKGHVGYGLTFGLPKTVEKFSTYVMPQSFLNKIAEKESAFATKRPFTYGVTRIAGEDLQSIGGGFIGGSIFSAGGLIGTSTEYGIKTKTMTTSFRPTEPNTKFLSQIDKNKITTISETGNIKSISKGEIIKGKGVIGQEVIKYPLNNNKQIVTLSKVASTNQPLRGSVNLIGEQTNPLIRNTKNIKGGQPFLSRGFSQQIKAVDIINKKPVKFNTGLQKNVYVGFTKRIDTIPTGKLISTPVKQQTYFVQAGLGKMRIYKAGGIKYTYKPTISGIVQVKLPKGISESGANRYIIRNLDFGGMRGTTVTKPTTQTGFNNIMVSTGKTSFGIPSIKFNNRITTTTTKQKEKPSFNIPAFETVTSSKKTFSNLNINKPPQLPLQAPITRKGTSTRQTPIYDTSSITLTTPKQKTIGLGKSTPRNININYPRTTPNYYYSSIPFNFKLPKMGDLGGLYSTSKKGANIFRQRTPSFTALVFKIKSSKQESNSLFSKSGLNFRPILATRKRRKR